MSETPALLFQYVEAEHVIEGDSSADGNNTGDLALWWEVARKDAGIPVYVYTTYKKGLAAGE